MGEPQIDHLFRHQSGKMVSILVKIFGFEHLEIIEDAVQDTFVKAIHAWSKGMPDNPEGWLTKAAKNRVIDLFRSLKADKARSTIFSNRIQTIHLDELFLDNQIEDSQLRMIFTACHPALDPRSQIAFALKTISGFSAQEIAAALLSQEGTIKKRLQRARKKIVAEQLAFEIPTGAELHGRLDRVLEVIYVIFNEGFHPNKKDKVIRKDLCGEALRLCKLILKKPPLRTAKAYALLALMCFHSARLESRVNAENELIPLSEQDRTRWFWPLVKLGNDAMHKAVELTDVFSSYHYEAAIASEHLHAASFNTTNWSTIAKWYEQLYRLNPQALTQLNLAVAYLQLGTLDKSLELLTTLKPKSLAKKEYLYYATMAELYLLKKDAAQALNYLDRAIVLVPNESQKSFLQKKRKRYQNVKP